MKIFPAIDIINSKAVRLYKGDYDKKTDYGEPIEIAGRFYEAGAEYLHIVDLDGAKSGDAPNLELITEIARRYRMFIEVGGGIRSLDVIEKYIDSGVERVIIGTAAVTDREFLCKAIEIYGDKIAVGADILNGDVKIRGWLESGGILIDDFMRQMINAGVKTVICTDISKDGAMQGTNLELYQRLQNEYDINITASGGVSSLDDVIALSKIGVDACIIGKAYYTGAIDLAKAIEVTIKK